MLEGLAQVTSQALVNSQQMGNEASQSTTFSASANTAMSRNIGNIVVVQNKLIEAIAA
jgi:hypothetical protein